MTRESISIDARNIARRVGQIAAEASLDGLDMLNALMAGFIYVCRLHMSDRAIARWLRACADALDAETDRSQAALRQSLNRKESKHGKAP
jgi:hypothetical protein